MKCACAILCSVACPAVQNFSTLSHKQREFREKKVTEHKMCVLIFCTTFVWNISHCKKYWARCDKNVCWSSCKVWVILVRFKRNVQFIDRVLENVKYQISRKSVQWQSRVVPCGQIWRSWYDCESNQPDATVYINLLFLVSSTCFGRCFRPSSEAIDCIYSIW